MASRDRRSIRSALRKKGFVEKEGGNHHRYDHYYQGEFTGVTTSVERGNPGQEFGWTYLEILATDLNLSNHDFIRFVDCPLDKEAYADRLIEREVIHPKAPDLSKPLSLSVQERNVIKERLKKLMDGELEDHRVYKLYGRVNSESFTRKDMKVLEEMESRSKQE